MFFVKGLILGFSIAAPVGPIGVLCIRKTLQYGRLSGLFSGLGAAVADTIYGIIAAFGLTLISNFLLAEQFWLRLIGGAFLVFLGIKTYFSKPTEKTCEVSHKTLTKDFISTFFLTLTNPMTILSYLGIFTALGLSSTAGNYTSASWLVTGVFFGSALWWLILSEGVTLFRKRMNLKVMVWVNRFAGMIIIGFGVVAWVSISFIHANQVTVENGLRPKVVIKGDTKMKLLEQMDLYHVPGVSIAVINEGQVEWAQGYGHITNDPASDPIDERTLFQAASISKPLTAFGALLLVQQGKLSLDEDVNFYLKRWKVPENEFTTTEKVTLRRLLSHTAGTSVHGFDGYAREAPKPTIVDILEGKAPLVNSDPVRVISKPGTEVSYSGGGTVIVQLLIEDVTGESFDVWMQNNVLEPLGMYDSTFKEPLHAAYGHYQNGDPVQGHWHVYPEMAPAGLWSTPKDLAQFILYVQSALKNEKTPLLNSSYIRAMTTRQKIGDEECGLGLGVFLRNQDQDLVFKHNGRNDGFLAELYGFAFKGQGVVVMANNDICILLMEQLLNSVADTYNWPHFSPIEKEKISINSTHLSHLAGLYQLGDYKLEVSLIKNQLFIDFQNGFSPLELHPSGNASFFIQSEDFLFEFSEENPDMLVCIDPSKEKTVYTRM